YEHNQDFHQIVDFVEESHIRYALTFNPTVYVSHIRQFWSTARIETTEEGTKILATVDGKLITIFESSIRRNLKLNDEAGISSLPNAELFENLTLMGYNISPNQKFTFQKGQFSRQWKYLIHTIMVFNFSKMIFDGMVRNVNNKVSKFLMYPSPSFSGRTVPLFPSMLVTMGEGSGTPTEPHHTPTSEASQSSQHELPSTSLPPVTTEPLPTVIPSDNPPLRQYTRRARIAQSSALLPVADELAFSIRDDSQGEACPTVIGLVAGQDRATITKTSTLPSDSTPRVTSFAADEGSMQQKLDELMALCTSLQKQHTEMASKIKAQELEINSLKARIKLLEDKDRGVAEQSGDDAPIKGRMVPTAAEVATATVSIPTGSGVVPTASPTIPTASPIFTTATESTPYTRRKGKEKMVESETPKKKKLQEQIDVQVAKELEEEMARYALRMNEQIARDAEIARIHAEEELQIMIDGLDRNNETVAKYLSLVPDSAKKASHKEQQREFYTSVLRNQAGWKAKHFKGMTLEEIKEKFDLDNAKKQKTSEEVPEEKLKEMMELIPVEEVYVEALQVKHLIIDWQHFDREDLNQLWALVKESLSIRPATIDKEMELWVDLKRLYEPDVEDQLWTHTQNIMHALVEWKLYDMCGVHHVIFKDQEIFMLVEKDY
nr:hypothetical protein [Tanacetum cinerariifolium]